MSSAPLKIYIARNGIRYGPYDENTFIQHLHDGSIFYTDHLWDQASGKWLLISESEYGLTPENEETGAHEDELDPGEALEEQLRKEYENKPRGPVAQSIHSPGLTESETKPLCEWLGLDSDELKDLSENSDDLYNPFPIDRPGKKPRWIEAPEERLKGVQRSILDRLLINVPLNGAAHGFVPNRSILTHASQHRKKRWVVTLDIRSFFPSVNARRVREVARELPIPDEDVEHFVNLTTRKDHLPQGAPTSPTLGNLVLRELDAKLCDLVRGTGWFYTRYADDLTFSGFKKPKEVLLEATRLIKAEGFGISEEKSRIRGKDQRQMVTGIVVNDKLALSRQKRNMVRGMRHRLQHGEVPDHELNHVLGWINFSDYVERCNSTMRRSGPSVRPRRISFKKICLALEMAMNGHRPKSIIRSLGISRSSFYRARNSQYVRNKLKSAGLEEADIEKICTLLNSGEMRFALDMVHGLTQSS